jgi:hypothetical protein
MIKANNVLVAWNGADDADQALIRGAPAGAVAVGPLLHDGEADWTAGYMCTGGAAEVDRRKMNGMPLRFYVMRDWYELVYGYGLHPFVVHTAFLHIEEYQKIIKEMGMGPGRGEFGHDPDVGYGRSVSYPVPEIEIRRIGQSVHVWPSKKPATI